MLDRPSGAPAVSVEVMRSQLGRARGAGSAKSGTHHWWLERVTAVALIPLTLWFVFATIHLAGQPQGTVRQWVANPINTVLLLALVAMTFHHMQLGLQVVMEDYIDNRAVRSISILCNKALALLLSLLCAVSILRMAFTA